MNSYDHPDSAPAFGIRANDIDNNFICCCSSAFENLDDSEVEQTMFFFLLSKANIQLCSK